MDGCTPFLYLKTKKMKRILSVLLLTFSVALYAQKDVTKFLGIPVDGTKAAMVQKLKAKGFRSDPTQRDVLVGTFNGSEVNVHIATNNDKVWRIMVCDKNTRGEGDIKIRFNNLCEQFENNKKYMSASSEDDWKLSDSEDISYEMAVNSKRYQAAYCQLPTSADTLAAQKWVQTKMLEKYSAEELASPTEEIQKEFLAGTIFYLLKGSYKRSVWFMISKYINEYYISMFYDNEYNMANGEDL